MPRTHHKWMNVGMLMIALLMFQGCSSDSSDATRESGTVRKKIVVGGAPEEKASPGTGTADQSTPAAGTENVGAAQPAATDGEIPPVISTPGEPAVASLKEPEKIGVDGASQKKGFMIDNKIDPFVSLFREDTGSVSNQASKRVPQGPLEMMALDQLKLTGVVRKQHVAKALVEEASGKGYVIEVGTYIGSNGGRVTQILDDRVIVQEESTDALGKKAVQERELKLLRGEGKKPNEK